MTVRLTTARGSPGTAERTTVWLRERLQFEAAAFLPGIKEGAAYQLASTRSPEFLPYLIVMLGSPSPSTRDLALISF